MSNLYIHVVQHNNLILTGFSWLATTLCIMTITITVEKDGYYEVNGNRQEPTVNLYIIPAASKLHRMLKDTKDLIVCPGVYDGLSARIAMDLGFKGLYMVCCHLHHLNLPQIATADTYPFYRQEPEPRPRALEWLISD